MALADLWENAQYLRLAAWSSDGASVITGHLQWLQAATVLKEGAAWTAFLLFGLSMHSAGRLAAATRPLLMLVPAVGVASLLHPALITARGWSVILPMPFLLAWFLALAEAYRPDPDQPAA